MDVGRHVRGIAADVEPRPLLEPGIDIAALPAQPLLHIGLWRGVAREGEIEPAQDAVLQQLLPFNLIEEVAAEIALAEKQPGASRRAPRFPLLHERAIGRDAGTGADHQDRYIVIRKMKVIVGLDIDRNCRIRLGTRREIAGSDSGSRQVVQRRSAPC